MDANKFKSIIVSSKESSITTSADSNSIHLRRRMMQNFLLIWLDVNIDQCNQDYQNTLTQLRSVVNEVNVFTNQDKCVDFLTEIDNEKAFMIVAGTISEQIVPFIHDIPQLDGIYIFCDNKSIHEQWVKLWPKIKGIHAQINSICEALNQTDKQFNQDSIAVSIVAVDENALNQNLDQLEPLFMYTQIFKEILLDMEYNRQSVDEFCTFCRNGNYGAPSSIDLFENEYRSYSPIWWYTSPSFIYSMINQALRNLEADIIINMGFFIHDLHHEIEQFHHQQVASCRGQPFTVYRGQGLLKSDFEKLVKTKGGLMSFNNFVSTSKNREVSLGFTEVALTETDKVGILFKMDIDPTISSAPFAVINDVSYFKAEQEVLFSMHTVFRIGVVKKIHNNDRLWQVDLKLTADDDQELRALTKRIREEAGGSGWHRMGTLLITIGQFNKAEELYEVLLDQTSDENEKALYYQQLGSIKGYQGDYGKAISYYEKSHEFYQKTLSPNHPFLASSYNNIGAAYRNKAEYSKALSFYEKALEIRQKTLPPNHSDSAFIYSNIGLVYHNMGEYSKGLPFYEKALEIRQKTLPPNHPDLAVSYNNIGGIYYSIGEYSKASSFFEKALEIRQKTLPPNHPELASSYNNIGEVYKNIGEYSKALSSNEKALEIRQKTLPPNHPDLATSYNNIAGVYDDIGEYSKALSSYQKALEIQQKTLPPNHPELATSYNNIAGVYGEMGEYSKALSSNEKALEIRQKAFPPNYSDLATSYNNIAGVYANTKEYSKALPFLEKAREIFEKTNPTNYPSLATSYNNVGLVYDNMGECSKALSFYEKSLDIRQKTLLPNHPDLANSYNNIGNVYRHVREYSKALSFYEKALEIQQKTLAPNHPSLGTSYDNIAMVYYSLANYSKALSFFERTLDIWKNSLPSNHPHIKIVQRNIESVKEKLQINVS